MGVRNATRRRSDRSSRELRPDRLDFALSLAIARLSNEPEGSADSDLVDFGDGPEAALQVGSLQVQRLPHAFAPELGETNDARGGVRRFLGEPDLVSVQAVQQRRVMGSEDELSPAGIGPGILENLNQSNREPGMKTRVDLIEQENVTESEGRECQTDQSEPGLRAGRFFLQIESDRFASSAMNDTKVTTRSTEAPSLLFGDHKIVDSRIREAKQVQNQAWIRNGWSIF